MLPRVWVDRQVMELDNVRAALTWSQSTLGDAELGLRLSWAVSSWLVGYTEARAWLEGALTRADTERADYPQARAVALSGLGNLATLQADYASAREHLAQSLVLFRELGDSPRCAWVLERLGLLAREQGDAVTARLCLAESLALYRELGDKIGLAQTLNTLGEVAIMQADIAEAAGLLNEALTLNRELENSMGIGWSLNHLGHVAQLQGEYELAMRLHEESLPLFRKIHHQFLGVGEANRSLGETALAQGDAMLATRRFREALKLFRYHGARALLAWCLAGLAGAAVLDEEPDRAACLWGAAEALRQSIGARQAPASRATRDRLMAAAREQLGEVAFEEAWAKGQAMTPEQAIERALGDQLESAADRLGPPG
jgi:non-specific serine/threonine protein kinase